MSMRARNMRTREILVPCLTLIGCSMTACLSLPVAPNVSNPIRQVAVLPLVNNTNDVEGPSVVRTRVADEVTRHAYVVKPQAEVDQMLKDQMGITLGSQLDMTTPQKLGEVLGVDGVIYGSLEDFSHNVSGVANVKRVRIRTKLVNCKTGETVWSDGLGIRNVSGMMASSAKLVPNNESDLPPLFGTPIKAKWVDYASASSAGGGGLLGSAVAGFGEKIATRAFKVPLYEETTAAVTGVLKGIPAGPEHVQSPFKQLFDTPRTQASTTGGDPKEKAVEQTPTKKGDAP
jgi:hypothetical protein